MEMTHDFGFAGQTPVGIHEYSREEEEEEEEEGEGWSSSP